MLVFETQAQRRLVLRLERGEELVASLTALIRRERVESGWVRGVGSLEWVELDRHDPLRRAAEPRQRFDAPAEIVSLTGSLSWMDDEPSVVLSVALARRTDNGVSMLGGRLLRAAVYHLELYVELFDDLRLERVRDVATGLDVWNEPSDGNAPARQPAQPRASRRPSETPREPSRELGRGRDEDDEESDDGYRDEPVPVAPSSGGVSWADVAAVSAAPEVAREPFREPSRSRGAASRRTTPSADEAGRSPDFAPPPIPSKRKAAEDHYLSQPLPEKGDFIQHRQFGLCKIDREDGEGGIVIRLPSGVRKTIKLDFMEIGHPRMEGGKRVFAVRPKGR